MEVKVLRPEILGRFTGNGLPRYGTPAAAGVDLYAALERAVNIEPGATLFVPTGLAIHIKNPALAGLILSRSGLGTKQGLVVKQGVGLVDADYQGEIMVALHNIGAETRTVSPGDRIAQFVVIPVVHAEWQVVSDFSEETVRGQGGFGSTGISDTTRPLSM